MKNFKKVLICFGLIIGLLLLFQGSKVFAQVVLMPKEGGSDNPIELSNCDRTNDYSNVTRYLNDQEYGCEVYYEGTINYRIIASSNNRICDVIPIECFSSNGTRYYFGEKYGFITTTKTLDLYPNIKRTTAFVFKIEAGVVGIDEDNAKNITTTIRPVICKDFLYFAEKVTNLSMFTHDFTDRNLIMVVENPNLVLPYYGADQNRMYIDSMNVITSFDEDSGAYFYGSDLEWDGFEKEKESVPGISVQESVTDLVKFVSGVCVETGKEKIKEAYSAKFGENKAAGTMVSFLITLGKDVPPIITNCANATKTKIVREKSADSDSFHHIYGHDDMANCIVITNSLNDGTRKICCGVERKKDVENTKFLAAKAIYEKTNNKPISINVDIELSIYSVKDQKYYTIISNNYNHTSKAEGTIRNSLSLEGDYKGILSDSSLANYSFNGGASYYKFICESNGIYSFMAFDNSKEDKNYARVILFNENFERICYDSKEITKYMKKGEKYFIKFDSLLDFDSVYSVYVRSTNTPTNISLSDYVYVKKISIVNKAKIGDTLS